ncbi:hypothetical protein BJY01DRAFT_96370 [Aspergillus pseudoustus]|uniref:Uncharacterized protein n=1 Tax=Aspergillus pseudoustus TaxID=1810923 RepID=A0ABR4KJH9_9EURO
MPPFGKPIQQAVFAVLLVVALGYTMPCSQIVYIVIIIIMNVLVLDLVGNQAEREEVNPARITEIFLRGLGSRLDPHLPLRYCRFDRRHTLSGPFASAGSSYTVRARAPDTLMIRSGWLLLHQSP